MESTLCSPGFAGFPGWTPPYCLSKIYIQYFYEIIRINVATSVISYTNLLTAIRNQPLFFDNNGKAKNSLDSLLITKSGYGIDIVTGYGLILKVYGYVWNDNLYINRYDIIPAKGDFAKTNGIFSRWNNDLTDDVTTYKDGTPINQFIDNNLVLFNTYR